jgi:alpha/beta superfamily hydrolase
MPVDTGLRGPAGPLEAIYRPLRGARAAAVLCHSHPQQGGTMYDQLLHRVACALHAAGVSSLRFNFRGVGGSAGRFDAGEGEQDDLRAALELAGRDHDELAVVGFSFGAWVGLRVGAVDRRVERMVGLGPPTSLLDFGCLAGLARPLLLVQGECDAWGTVGAAREHVAAAGPGARLVVIAGADHFFRGRQDVVAAATVDFVARSGDR